MVYRPVFRYLPSLDCKPCQSASAVHIAAPWWKVEKKEHNVFSPQEVLASHWWLQMAYGVSCTPAGKLGVKELGFAYKNTNVNQITRLEAIAPHFPLFFCQGAPYQSLLSSGVCLLSLNNIFSWARKDNKHAPCILQKGLIRVLSTHIAQERVWVSQPAGSTDLLKSSWWTSQEHMDCVSVWFKKESKLESKAKVQYFLLQQDLVPFVC